MVTHGILKQSLEYWEEEILGVRRKDEEAKCIWKVYQLWLYPL
jgi:hypothetical protein